MRNTKLVAGLSVTALAAVGVTALAMSDVKETKQNVAEMETTAEEIQVAEDDTPEVEYTGAAIVTSSLLDSLYQNVENNTKLTEQTGSLMYSEAGMSEVLDGYNSYMAVADAESSDASLEALDVALKFVPEGSVIEGYENLGVSNVTSYLNVREGAGTNKEIVGKMPGGSACEVLAEEDGWYKIKSGSVTGYVSKEYILTGYDANVKAMETMTNVLKVECDVLNVRQEPSQNCNVSTQVQNGEILEITEEEKDGWYKININNLEGYVSAEFVKEVYTLPVAEEVVKLVVTTPSTNSSNASGNTSSGSSNQGGNTQSYTTLDQTVSQTAIDLINYAYQFLGNPYVYGGNSLTNGIDCSGFVKQIFAKFGYSLPRTSSAYPNAGTRINYQDAKPGDILVYRYADGSGHVAIYIGNGKIVHASTPKTGICISNAYYTTPYCAVRVIP